MGIADNGHYDLQKVSVLTDEYGCVLEVEVIAAWAVLVVLLWAWYLP